MGTLGDLVGIALLACAVSCGSAAIAGGRTVNRGDEPQAPPLFVFGRITCSDSANGPVPADVDDVIVVRHGRGYSLIDRRQGRDSIVVDNSFERGSRRIFQVALKSRRGRPMLREYRVSPGGAGGVLVVASEWADEETAGGFVAEVEKPIVTCRLLP